jgi:hypothetical protein
MTKSFLLGEGRNEPSSVSYLRSLEEMLNSVRPSNQRDRSRIEMAKESVKGLRRHVRRLEEQNNTLSEKLSLLEEAADVSDVEE